MRRSRVNRLGRSAAAIASVLARAWAPALVLVLAVTAAGSARADGGIPGSLAILLPLDNPQEIGLATTFGLILSDDGGTTWQWTCEQVATTSMANIYSVGGPAIDSGGLGDRFYALSPLVGFAYSDDQSCTWHSAGGVLGGQAVSDYFVDPSDPTHVLAAAAPAGDGGAASAAGVFVSHDGGVTFGATPLYTAPAGASVVGIEIARTDPNVIYLAYLLQTATGYDPVLVRTPDGGQTWTPTDLTAPLGPNIVRILAVDSANPDLVYLRVTGTSEAVAVTRDGGATFATPIPAIDGAVTAFARLASGTVLVGTEVNDSNGSGATTGVAYRSTDAAMTFMAFTPTLAASLMTQAAPHLVGLAERVVGGQATLYLSAKNYSDGWALGTSSDEGLHVTPVMSYIDVASIKPCVQQICADTCTYEEMQAIWMSSVCTGGEADAGTSGDAGGGKSGSGCSCMTGGGLSPEAELGAGVGLVLGLWLALAATRRKRRRDLSRSGPPRPTR